MTTSPFVAALLCHLNEETPHNTVITNMHCSTCGGPVFFSLCNGNTHTKNVTSMPPAPSPTKIYTKETIIGVNKI